jgi:hypothetical protein
MPAKKVVLPRKLELQIVEFYKTSGLGLYPTGAHFGVGAPTVRKTLIKHGVPLNPQGTNAMSGFRSSHPVGSTVKALWIAGGSVKSIREELGLPRWKVINLVGAYAPRDERLTQLGRKELAKPFVHHKVAVGFKWLLEKKCVICGSTEDLHVDHCQVTNAFRGLLCRGCNHDLGNFKDNVEVLRRAIMYLRQKKGPGS